MALYQDIMSVPGLTGTWQQRLKTFGKQVFGNAYTGSLSQNSQLTSRIKSGATSAPKAVAPSAPAAGGGLAEGFANQAGANKVYKGPVFSQVLPFYQSWERLLPTVTEEAQSQINPGINRQLGQDLRTYNLNLAASGGGRFGRGFGGRGMIEAEAERNRKSGILDWISQRQQGFKSLFYDPSEKAFTRAIELGQTPTTPKVPTWQEFIKTQGSTLQPAI